MGRSEREENKILSHHYPGQNGQTVRSEHVKDIKKIIQESIGCNGVVDFTRRRCMRKITNSGTGR